MNDKTVIHFISNTHWDREWLHNFQETRMMLVAFFDALLEMLETRADYRSYVLDSQAAPVEDYLAIRPENRERVAAQVRAGRLLIGPWYTCPEGFEVNGESLVRNLLMGHQVAGAFGHVMKVGHTPFSYGQNSQMPQIYAGFGIDAMLFYHGVSHEEVSNEWIFEGADGTRILGSQMSSGARYNFYHGVYRPAVIGKTMAEREYCWREGGLPFHRAAPEHALTHYLLADPLRSVNRAALEKAATALRAAEMKVATTRHIAFMMGHDSSVPDPLEPEMMAMTAALFSDAEVRHGQYEEYMAAVKAEVDRDALPVLRGERRTPKPMPVTLHLYSDVLSSRTRMKYRSARAEYLLQRRVDPFVAVAAQLGAEYPASLLELAWETMLTCHAHDSISGSGVDAIEEDMMNRLRQVLDIGEGLYARALMTVQSAIDARTLPGDATLLTVYNPAPRARSEVVTAVIDLPWQGPRPRGQFTLRDAATGKETAVQCAARGPHWAVVNHAYDAPSMMESERFTVHFEAGDLPGLGYATYVVDRGGSFVTGSLLRGANTLENEHLRASVQPDGTIVLTDKTTGRTWRDLHYFVDDGEGGHAWMHVAPAFDRAVDSRGFPVSVAVEEDGPLLARIRVECRMRIPSGLNENGGDPWQRLDGVGNRASRGAEERELNVVSLITLRRHGRALEISMSFDNTAENHRLRLMLPTRLTGVTCHAESAFDVVERETVFGEDSVWRGATGVTFPMQRFVDVSDGDAGLAFICAGLREYEVTADDDRSIAVTLMRAYEVNLTTVSYRWERHSEMKLSQSPGHHAFSYRLYPHAGDYETGGVLLEADWHVTPLEPIQAGRSGGHLPMRAGFLEVGPDAVQMSAYKRAATGDGWVVRLYNPTPETREARLGVPETITGAALLTLEEHEQESLPLTKGCVTINMPPRNIATVLLKST